MHGDYSRDTFDRKKRFSLVRMQQGRLFSDADWNEQGDILRSADRDTARDLIGPAGFPDHAAGFELSIDPKTGEILIAPGIGYVAGVRHELDTPTEGRVIRRGGNGDNALWRVFRAEEFGDGDVLRVVDNDGNATLHVVRDFELTEDGWRQFRTTPGMATGTGRFERVTTLSRQPYAPDIPLPEAADDYLAYLTSRDVPVTALDDPDIREVAFDGPDTATRDRAVWQVGLVSFSDLLARGFTKEELTCPGLNRAFDPITGPQRRGKMKARAELTDMATGPCTLPPAAGYRSLDNLLYILAIHRGGIGEKATFKWSRENAIHRTRYRSVDAGVLIVDSIGRDTVSALKTGDWIEICDPDTLRAQGPGFFARIDEVIGTRVSLDALHDPLTGTPLLDNGQPDLAKLPPAAFVTRWEGGPPRPVLDATEDWLTLESGVQIHLDDGVYQAGDYWQVPARAVTGDVDWPRHPTTGKPLTRLPDGPRRDYAALALLKRGDDGQWSISRDCRSLFPAATAALKVNFAGGDGQEVLPDPLAPATRIRVPDKLCVSVTRGHEPVAGELVEFLVTAGDGRFVGGFTETVIATDSDGIARAEWFADATTQVQHVTARRLDTARDPTHAPLRFTATLSQADQTAFDPTDVPDLAGANTVQKAIEALAAIKQQTGCSTYVITPEQDWVARLESLAERENASICFTRGVYTATRAVRMQALGHIRISGAGPGTTQIIVDRSETALGFVDCSSVALSNLTLGTPAGASGVTDALRSGRNGTVDISHCPEVEITGCAISCGAGTSAGRTCISVRGWTRELNQLRATRSVHIRGNTLTMGHMQQAVLVSDALAVDVSGNAITAKPGKPASLKLDAFLADPAWLAKTSASLLTRPVKGKTLLGKDTREIRAEGWRVGFQSPVPQADWDKLVEARPPSEEELKSLEAFEGYSVVLMTQAAEDFATQPDFEKQLDRLRETLGNDADRLDDPKVRMALLVTSDPQAYRFDGKEEEDRRSVLLEANGEVVSFDSPFDQNDWTLALSRRKEAAEIANSDQLLGLARDMAARMLTDKKFREGMGSVSSWLTTLNDYSPAMGEQGIVCAGRVLGDVRICDNRIGECEVGIRVAASHLKDQRHDADSVLIENNRLMLMARNDTAYAGYGMFVGNARTLRICGNDMALSKRPNYRRFFAQGIRVWGFIGRQVLITQNRIAMATMGVRLHHVDPEMNGVHLCVLSQNLVEGPDGTVVFKASPKSLAVIDENNWAFQGL